MCVYEEVCVVSGCNVKKKKVAIEEKREERKEREKERREKKNYEYFLECGRRERDKKVH